MLCRQDQPEMVGTHVNTCRPTSPSLADHSSFRFGSNEHKCGENTGDERIRQAAFASCLVGRKPAYPIASTLLAVPGPPAHCAPRLPEATLFHTEVPRALLQTASQGQQLLRCSRHSCAGAVHLRHFLIDRGSRRGVAPALLHCARRRAADRLGAHRHLLGGGGVFLGNRGNAFDGLLNFPPLGSTGGRPLGGVAHILEGLGRLAFDAFQGLAGLMRKLGRSLRQGEAFASHLDVGFDIALDGGNHLLNFAGGCCRTFSQFADLVSDDGEAASMLTCPRGLDGSVQCQQVCLFRNFRN